MPVEVKPNAIIVPLDESKGLSLRLPRNGDTVLGAALDYEGLETRDKGELRFAQKPQRVFLKGLDPVIGAINTNPDILVELGSAIKKIQQHKA
jgi:hypothetical protein